MPKFMDIHDWINATIALIFFVGNVYCFMLFMEMILELGETGASLLLLMMLMFVCYVMGTDAYSAFNRRVMGKRIQAELDAQKAIRKLQGEDY
jgi:uncharacterized membrane protein